MAGLDVRVAIRKVLMTTLAPLTAAQDSVLTIVYRPTRAPVKLPAITIFDSGEKIDDMVPLYRRSLQVDIWTQADLDLAEQIAHDVNALLDHQPLLLTGVNDVGLVAHIMLQSDEDTLEGDGADADFTPKLLTYT